MIPGCPSESVPQSLASSSVLIEKARKRFGTASVRVVGAPRRPAQDEGPFDFIYICATFDRLTMAAAIAAWSPLLRSGGSIAGDFIQSPEVRSAVFEAFGLDAWFVGSEWIVARTPESRALFCGFTGLMLATPCYGGQVGADYFMSALRTVLTLEKKQIVSEFKTAPGDSLVQRARNSLVAVFMASPYSHLLFIDADLEWMPSAVLRLLRSDKDLIVGAYPKKKIPTVYPINFLEGSEKQVEQCPISGAIRIRDAATGFMMIRKSVIERMMAAHPELQYEGTASLTPEEDRFAFALFDVFVHGRRLLSEDYGFCHRWRALGGSIWLEPSIKLDHHGSYAYRGDVSELFRTEQPAAKAAE